MKHLLTLSELGSEGIMDILDLAQNIKAKPEQFAHALEQKVLLMIFEKPSLRTRISFESGMARMGGHAIYYDTQNSPMGSGKESVHDTVKVASRFVDAIMARLFEHSDLEKMASASDVPVINGLTNYNHPCQILADLLTISEKKGSLKGLTLSYMGDSNNNVTHSLMHGCAMVGMNIRIGCPDDSEYTPDPTVLETSQAMAQASGGSVSVIHNPDQAAEGADVLYTDTWMSYHIPREELEQRLEILKPYQINEALMAKANQDAIFMNCLPAMRGFEQTSGVIDGPASVVFDQAENRMFAQNAVLLRLLGQA